VASALYEQISGKVVCVSSTRVAESAKLLENTFRSVNIALANEMALICHHIGVDVWEVVEAAATKPFGFMSHYPGPGIGGHCIPLDPHYLAWKARLSGYDPHLISVASAINSSMPRHVVSLIADALNDQGLCLRNSRVLVLGVAYKPNVGDCRESPAIDILRMLLQKGADVLYSDPYVPHLTVQNQDLCGEAVTSDVLGSVDCSVIVTHHDAFDYEKIVLGSKVVIDSRNAARRFHHLGRVISL